MASSEKRLRYIFLWLLAGVLAVALAWSLDSRVDAALDVPENAPAYSFAYWFSKLAEGWVPAVLGIGLAFIFVLARRPVAAAKVFFVTLTCEFTGMVALLLRIFTGRTRPLAHVPQGFYGVWHNGHWIVGKYEFSAFPSGHAATAVGLAAAAWLVHHGWGAVAGLFALTVMWARIALQCHHLSDVVASTMLAIPLAVLCKKVLLPSMEFQFTNLHQAWKRE